MQRVKSLILKVLHLVQITCNVVVHFILRLKALGLPGEDPNHPILKIGQMGSGLH